MNTNLRYYVVGLVAMVALFCPRTSAAQELKRISPEEALSYTNHPYNVVVTGKVVEVIETDKAVHLNFGKPRPDETFTVLVYAYAAPSFPGLKEMKGKTIEATGSISLGQGKPYMGLRDPKNFKVVPEKK